MKGILRVWQKHEGTTGLKWELRIFGLVMYNGEVITLLGFCSTLTRKKTLGKILSTVVPTPEDGSTRFQSKRWTNSFIKGWSDYII
jgi:hypothetical protein